MIIGPIGFTTPLLLGALIMLPLLWLLLRAVPPAPLRRRFPGVALLLGLKDSDSVTDRTPWWLLLLRTLAVAAVIIGLAGPVLNPEADTEQGETGSLLLVLDHSWASAASWPAQAALLDGMLAEAGRDGRPVALLRLSEPATPVFQSAEAWRSRLSGLTPAAWFPDLQGMAAVADTLGDGMFETRWFSDGVDRDGRAALLEALEARGTVTVYETATPLLALMPPEIGDTGLTFTALRMRDVINREIMIEAYGRDPSGQERLLTTLPLTFAETADQATGTLNLPPELRARITRFQLSDQRHAGAVALTDDSLHRREVALIAGRQDREGLELLSPLHYLERALSPTADLLEGAISDILPAKPDVIVLADVATLSVADQDGILTWVQEGGLLLRFAGQRLAASDVSRAEESPLMPVRLRAGGRSVGGAMSWGQPKALAPFAENSPFKDLSIPADVTVSSQVMAQPDPTLADRVIAQLSDGTPLVTRKYEGAGQIVLFHITANAEWSSLPLSGLFVQMLERLAVSSAVSLPTPETLRGTTWTPIQVLDGLGRLRNGDTLPGVDGEVLLSSPFGPHLRPGVYEGPDRRLALNVVDADIVLRPVTWPSRITVEGLSRPAEAPLAGWFLGLALILFMADIFAALALSGRLLPRRTRGAHIVAVLIAVGVLFVPHAGQAQQGSSLPPPASEMMLAHVITGNAQVDGAALAGLRGLSEVLFFRTSVEPSDPVGVDLETDELSFFPFLYWPITPDQPSPSAAAYARLNSYLRTGGMILFDTRDANVAGFGAASPNGAKLQRLAAGLDIPPLEPVPADHVLTRTFYLLQDFPGRHSGRRVWVEAAPPDAERVEGMPFRNLNDNVTPVVIGGNDWASAWAVGENGKPLYPVGRGFAGDRQREMAYRFGVNLVMHLLTGNYKSDQVHVPALLDRLGQ